MQLGTWDLLSLKLYAALVSTKETFQFFLLKMPLGIWCLCNVKSLLE